MHRYDEAAATGPSDISLKVRYAALVEQHKTNQLALDPNYNPLSDPIHARAKSAFPAIFSGMTSRDDLAKAMDILENLPGIDGGKVDERVQGIMAERSSRAHSPRVIHTPKTPVYDSLRAKLTLYSDQAQADPSNPKFRGEDTNHPLYVRRLEQGGQLLKQALLYEMTGREVPQDITEFFERDLFDTPVFNWGYNLVVPAIAKARDNFGLSLRPLSLDDLDGIGHRLAEIKTAEEDGKEPDKEAVDYFTSGRYQGHIMRVVGLMVVREQKRVSPEPEKAPESVADLVAE